MSLQELMSAALIVAGTLCFIAGTVGFLRFPDLFTRLHALTKADNLGLGLIASGGLLLVQSIATAVMIIAVWLLVMIASATTGHLIARDALRRLNTTKD